MFLLFILLVCERHALVPTIAASIILRGPGRLRGARASLALDKCGRTHAWLAGRDYVDPEDIRAIAPDVLRHRLGLTFEAQGEGVTPDRVVSEILKQVALT